MKRWKLAVLAALGLGVADCGDDTAQIEYGPAISQYDLSAAPDLSAHDASQKD